MDINWLEWMGYAASAIILISLLMSSVKKLRWINLVGSSVFAAYGILIESIPVAVMNIGIVLINLWYLWQMYSKKEYFKILKISSDSKYLKSFLKFYKSEIKKFSTFSKATLKNSEILLLVLRDMAVAGVFICSKYDKNTLKVELDFATPQYRDFKIGRFIFEKQKDFFLKKGYTKLLSFSDKPAHISYLKKMGFKLSSVVKNCWVKKLK